LLDKGADMNMPDREGFTPLSIAALYGHAYTVKFFLDKGADINAINNFGATPLFTAASKGQIEIVKILVGRGANIDMASRYGTTPLLIAAEYGHIDVVEFLITKGANTKATDASGKTLLFSAASRGHTDIVEMVMNEANMETPNNHGATPLFIAASNGHVDTVRFLVTKGANMETVNELGKTPLFVAAEYGNIEVVEFLLTAGAVAPDGIEAIAHGNGYAEIAELIRVSRLPKWKGFSRSDIEILDSIFNPELANNMSCCPVCFKVVEGRAQPLELGRIDSCRYMKHNCSTAGGHYHAGLYEMYKSPSDGTINWCTICGRICSGHAHHALALAQGGRKAGLLAASRDPSGGEAMCMADGGGGLLEKLSRYRRMREFALQLQHDINKMLFVDAIDALIEETWNAPLFMNLDLPNIAASGKWNISSNRFVNGNVTKGPVEGPAEVPTEAAAESASKALGPATDVRWPFQGRPVMLPHVAHRTGDVPVIKLVHRKRDGVIVTHRLTGIEALLGGVLFENLSAAGSPTFGRCAFGEDACSAIVYPGELQYILDKYEDLPAKERDGYQDKIDTYRRLFNEACRDRPEFKARVEEDVAAAAAMAVGGAGAAAGQGGGKRRVGSNRRTRRIGHKQHTNSRRY
jgi:hypothetical protein